MAVSKRHTTSDITKEGQQFMESANCHKKNLGNWITDIHANFTGNIWC